MRVFHSCFDAPGITDVFVFVFFVRPRRIYIAFFENFYWDFEERRKITQDSWQLFIYKHKKRILVQKVQLLVMSIQMQYPRCLLSTLFLIILGNDKRHTIADQTHTNINHSTRSCCCCLHASKYAQRAKTVYIKVREFEGFSVRKGLCFLRQDTLYSNIV